MTFSDFQDLARTLKRFALQRRFGRIELFANAQPIKPNHSLRKFLKKLTILDSETWERQSQELLSYMFKQLKDHCTDPIELNSGVYINVDKSNGLDGVLDFVISYSPPGCPMKKILLIVDYGREDLDSVIRCIAEMVGVSRYNNNGDAVESETVYSAIFTSTHFCFLSLRDNIVIFDTTIYMYSEIDKILGILKAIVTSKENGQK